jgi:glutamine cyclotransferase
MKHACPAWWGFVVFVSVVSAFGQTLHKNFNGGKREYTFEVIRQFPHDPQAFTQGLVYKDGYFYEGTGRKGLSSLRQVQVETGQVVRQVNLAPDLFGEGITIYQNQIIQLTWQAHVGFVYSLDDFRLLRKFSYPGEGWGIAADVDELFISDGTPDIRVLDPNTLAQKRILHVQDGTSPVSQLNELEFVEGEIFANVWHTNRIARISPKTGEVVGWIDLTGILSPVYSLDPEAVLNGIAYDRKGKRLFVTGKLWPTIFQIRLISKKSRLRD